MAKKKRPATKPQVRTVSQSEERTNRFPNLLLALTFIIVILLLISLFFRNNGSRLSLNSLGNLFTRSNSAPTPSPSPMPSVEQKAVAGEQYKVRAGDTLWSIAEEAYGSGFNASDIIAANKIQNPTMLKEGTNITLPKVEAKAPTRGEIAGTEVVTSAPKETPKTYTVQKGDTLWDIAQKVYGDPYQWKAIAQANKLVNPRLIHAGNVFVLPAR